MLCFAEATLRKGTVCPRFAQDRGILSKHYHQALDITCLATTAISDWGFLDALPANACHDICIYAKWLLSAAQRHACFTGMS